MEFLAFLLCLLTTLNLLGHLSQRLSYQQMYDSMCKCMTCVRKDLWDSHFLGTLSSGSSDDLVSSERKGSVSAANSAISALFEAKCSWASSAFALETGYQSENRASYVVATQR